MSLVAKTILFSNEDYADWSIRMESHLKAGGLWNCIKGSNRKGQVKTEAEEDMEIMNEYKA